MSLWRNRTRASYSILLTSLLKNFLNVYYLFSFPLLVMTCLYSLSISILECLPLYEWFAGGISIVCILVLRLFYKLQISSTSGCSFLFVNSFLFLFLFILNWILRNQLYLHWEFGVGCMYTLHLIDFWSPLQ